MPITRYLGLGLLTAVICGVWAAPAMATTTVAPPSFSASEQVNFTGAITTFTSDDMPSPSASNFTATIDWGDGTMSAGTVSGAPGGPFTVSVPSGHTYTDGATPTVTVTVNDSSPPSAASNHAVVTVTDAALTASGPSAITVAEGATLSGALAHIADADPTPTPPLSAYTARVAFGDGASSAATVTAGPSGGVDISAPHAYAEEGSDTAVVTVTDAGGSKTTRSVTVTVIDAPLSATPAFGTIASGASFAGALATFADGDPGGAPGDYAAQILWGDGSASAGTVTAAASGFLVSGAHTYTKSGTYGVTALIRDAGGQSAVAGESLVVTVPIPPPTHCVVPNLVGQGTTAARRLLAAARCRLGKTRRDKHLKRGQNATVVIAQSPRARTVTTSGAAVDVTLGRPRARRHR